jgi:hypothetical protein
LQFHKNMWDKMVEEVGAEEEEAEEQEVGAKTVQEEAEKMALEEERARA